MSEWVTRSRDDFLTKPYNHKVLLARIMANIRRVQMDAAEPSVLLSGEQLSLRLLIGFFLIFVAIIISETFPLKRKQPDGAVEEAI